MLADLAQSGSQTQNGTMAGDFNDPAYEFLRPIVTGWLGKIANAIEAKKPFTAVSDQCMAFFAGSTGFMWDPKFQSQFLKGKLSPKFKMTLCKAFELVALFGPTLYWKNPARRVQARPMLELSPDLFDMVNQQGQQGMTPGMQSLFSMMPPGMLQQQPQPGPDGQMQQPPSPQELLFQFSQEKEQKRFSEARIRAELMERYLNYTPVEQPGDGLASHSEMAITEALVKGRGCLWVEPYKMPGSQRTLTGSFYDSVDNLLIDPDAESIEDAMWIARRHCGPHWVVERKFGYPEGYLKNKASLASANAQGEISGDDLKKLNSKTGKTFDLIVWYEIWSKGGIGSRLSGVNTQLKDAFARVVGDYAYICVAPNVPFPLNGQSGKVRDGSEGDVRKMFEWPAAYWADDRWPVALLDFYRKPRSAWPIAPLAPGLGELIFINILTSHLANRIWSSSRDLIAVLKSAAKNVKAQVESGEDQVVFELEDINRNINEVVQFLDQPSTNMDAWQILDRMADSFNKRVGLNELLYGMNPGGVQSRTAEDISTKREMATIRIDYMSGKVEKWQTEAARMEKLCARWFVLPDDVRPHIGEVGAYLWERYISSQDPEVVLREIDCTVEAGSIRKPNKQREADNMQQLYPIIAPQMMKFAELTGNTEPMNGLNKLLGRSIDQDMTGMELPPLTPPPPDPNAPPPPEVVKAQAEQQALQMKSQNDQQMAQMKMQGEQVRMQGDQQRFQMETQKSSLDLEMKKMDMIMKQLDIQAKQGEVGAESARQQGEQAAEQIRVQTEMWANQTKAAQEMQINREQADQTLEIDRERADQELVQNREQNQQQTRMSALENMLKTKQMKEQGDLKVQLAKKAAAAKPKPKPSGGKK